MTRSSAYLSLTLLRLCIQIPEALELLRLALVVSRVSVQGVEKPVPRMVGVPGALVAAQSVDQSLLFFSMPLGLWGWRSLAL